MLLFSMFVWPEMGYVQAKIGLRIRLALVVELIRKTNAETEVS